MLYVWLAHRAPNCWYTVAGNECKVDMGSCSIAAGPFATMAECDAWIVGQGRQRGVPWLC